MPESLRIRLIVILVLPHLDYSCAAFTNMTEQDIRMRRAINSCLRYVYGVRWDDHITSDYRLVKDKCQEEILCLLPTVQNLEDWAV